MNGSSFSGHEALARFLKDSKEFERTERALEAIQKAGGKAFLVGGAVRDVILGVSTKDVDIEVHGLALESLTTLLGQFGKLSFVGKSFGILKWHHSSIDWALPRRDFSGRKPEVILDPSMSIKAALVRRDLTINAMALDLETDELIDPFHGLEDLKMLRARTPDPLFFVEDPLRFYRVMQFIGRFALKPDKVLNDVCKSMDIRGVSKERIENEFDKLFLKSRRPSLGIRWLHEIGRLYEVLPELAMTKGILQEYQWHPEGDVFEHTMQAIDAAVENHYDDLEEKLTVVSAVLCHDLGKSLATKIVNGRIRSTGHDEEGVVLARNLMRRITGVKKRIDRVAVLVRNHMAPGTFIRNNASDSAYRRLAYKLSPLAHCRLLIAVADADMRGRNGKEEVPLSQPVETVTRFNAIVEKLGLLDGPEKPVLTGKDLEEIVEPGPERGRLLKNAYEIQINEHVTSKDILLKRIVIEGNKSRQQKKRSNN